jgi:hypothetical protein
MGRSHFGMLQRGRPNNIRDAKLIGRGSGGVQDNTSCRTTDQLSDVIKKKTGTRSLVRYTGSDARAGNGAAVPQLDKP